MPSRDFFPLAYRSFRAVSWIWILFLAIGVFGIIRVWGGDINGAVVWSMQSLISLGFCLFTARLFKNRSDKAITFGYVTVAITLVLSAIFFAVATYMFTGLIFVAIFIYLTVIVIRAQRQVWRSTPFEPKGK